MTSWPLAPVVVAPPDYPETSYSYRPIGLTTAFTFGTDSDLLQAVAVVATVAGAVVGTEGWTGSGVGGSFVFEGLSLHPSSWAVTEPPTLSDLEPS